MSQSIHASAIVVGEQGLLIRGLSGSGKSLLSLAVIGLARRMQRFAVLVADDRVLVSVASGRVIAACVPGFEGWIERRGEGLIQIPFERQAVIRLVVDLAPRGDVVPRMPSNDAHFERVLATLLPRMLLDLSSGLEHGASAVLDGLIRVEKGDWRKNAG